VFERELELILDYNMSNDEAIAFKLMLLYQEYAKKNFPEYFHIRMPKGDPRKCTTFRYCHTLLMNLRGKLELYEYRMYIQAQMDVMRDIGKKTGEIPLIQPNILVGEKAWRRWLVWKRRYEKLEKEKSVENQLKPISWEKVKVRLDETKAFLQKQLKVLNNENVQKALKGRSLIRWVATQQVCGYYVLLSPMLKEWLTEKNLLTDAFFFIDTELYRPAITPEVEAYFRQEFSHEFE